MTRTPDKLRTTRPHSTVQQSWRRQTSQLTTSPAAIAHNQAPARGTNPEHWTMTSSRRSWQPTRSSPSFRRAIRLHQPRCHPRSRQHPPRPPKRETTPHLGRPVGVQSTTGRHQARRRGSVQTSEQIVSPPTRATHRPAITTCWRTMAYQWAIFDIFYKYAFTSRVEIKVCEAEDQFITTI